MSAPRGAQSKLFEPLTIANGRIKLRHRVVLAPLTRNRGISLDGTSPAESPNQIWVPDELVAEYYAQRTTDGGLLISEATPPNREGAGFPCVPGMYDAAQLAGWQKVTKAVHAKGGYIYAQLWHQGRATISLQTGMPTVSSSATPWDDPNEPFRRLPGATRDVKYVDYPPIELSKEHIKRTIADYCSSAKLAMEAGFDGIEVHGANGYLPEQFLNSNVNKRTDEYGGSPEKRTRFVVELMEALAETVGGENCSIRLSPFGLFNQMRGEQRIETWSYLCQQIKEKIPNLSYLSVIEPRFEQIIPKDEKDSIIKSWGLSPEHINLDFIRKIMGDTPMISGGGWNDKNSWGVLESGKYDGLVYGRYFISNPDLPERLKLGRELTKYDRDTFYGPTLQREVGYTDYLTWDEQSSKLKSSD